LDFIRPTDRVNSELDCLDRVRCLHETHSEQAVTQNEALFKPAIVVKPEKQTSPDEQFSLLNIGQGPAIELHWEISGTPYSGVFPYLEVGVPQIITSLRGLAEPTLQMKHTPSIRCRYQSISGWKYKSVSHYKAEQFTTDFEDVPPQ
jgi:hypothetical protein